MNIRELQEKIIALKEQKDVCILAHAYQSHDILEIADYVGDSFGLSQKAKKAPNKNIIMAGVRFMAETVKILSPEKCVILPNKESLCPMAADFTREAALKLKADYPNYALVAYINTTAALKTVADVIVTSSSAVNIIRNMEEKDILFIPDPNLGSWVASQLPEKNIKVFDGGCPIHKKMTLNDVYEAKKKYPKAQLLVHPESPSEIVSRADYVGSTTGIINYVKTSIEKEFIISTENSIADHLEYDCPNKKMIYLSKKAVCYDMKMTTLMDIYRALLGTGGEKINLDPQTIKLAKKSINRMITLA